MEYRKMKKGEELESARISAQAFNFKMDVEKFNKELADGKHTVDISRVAINENGKMVASLVLLPYEVHFDGHIVKSGGIGNVASLPEHRRGGNIRKLFELIMQEMYDDGYTFSYLYPFSFKYYRMFGYELGTTNLEVEVDIDKLFQYRQKGHAEVFEAETDPKDIVNIYNEFAKSYNFMLDRDGKHWRRMLEKDKDETLTYTYVWYNEENKPLAYIMYRMTDIPNEFNKNLQVRDIAWTCKEGLLGVLGLLGYLAGNTLKAKIELPQSTQIDAICPELWDFGVKRSFLGMNRIVNVEKAFELMKKPEAAGSVVIKVEDAFFKLNNKTYQISWEGNTTVCESQETPDLTCSVAALSQLVTGFKTLSQMGFRDDVVINGNECTLNKLFIEKQTFIGDYF